MLLALVAAIILPTIALSIAVPTYARYTPAERPPAHDLAVVSTVSQYRAGGYPQEYMAYAAWALRMP